MRTYQGLKLSAKIPVYDHADTILYFADRAKAVELITSGRAEMIYTSRRVRGLRLSGPDPALLPGESGRRPQAGMSHRHENYFNPRGVWHIDHIPRSIAPLFGRA